MIVYVGWFRLLISMVVVLK